MLTHGLPFVTHMACHVSPTWFATCHPHGLPCVIHMARHVSPDTRCLEIREILTISKFNEIRFGSQILQDDSNGAIHFVIQDL